MLRIACFVLVVVAALSDHTASAAPPQSYDDDTRSANAESAPAVAPPQVPSSAHRKPASMEELLRLVNEVAHLENALKEKANRDRHDDDSEERDVASGPSRIASIESKRTGGAWDLDYGWGGGRFGKRRGDRLGLAGRFGRSVRSNE